MKEKVGKNFFPAGNRLKVKEESFITSNYLTPPTLALTSTTAVVIYFTLRDIEVIYSFNLRLTLLDPKHVFSLNQTSDLGLGTLGLFSIRSLTVSKIYATDRPNK